jgi:hypothetical protein
MEAREEARGKSARQKMGEMERDGETNKREPSGDRYQPGRVSMSIDCSLTRLSAKAGW